ncbi:protein FAM185A isoform X1 [Neophocaena asiaeorientalis asiaeorientalis]|uniref:Protein FAM185A isoform X1 n=1 Tax=Neophocaena asiaeorientalis asiaeorientalis TaxID=1706337 RepID=A0A341ATL9_NEOAA|nr:protein FAM185A isoform X1 [Neophocaena asiaeorientalis asiaeorientalis]
MFVPCSGWGLGCLRLCLLRVWASEVAGRCACGACQARLYSSGGSQPDVSRSGPACRTPKEWALLVSPFGRLRTRLPCSLAVRPLDPLTYPDGDRVLVAVSGVEGGAVASLQVRYDEAQKEVAIVSDVIDPQASVEVNAPLKFDLNIKSSGSGCVKVENIECDNCKIETEQGTSILQSVKSQKLHIQTKGGKVICLGTVYGNIDIHASDKSTVTVDKLQGSSVNVSTEDGLLKAKCLYTESSFLSSAAGDITLGSVHGNITLQSKMGNITVDSSSGCLSASTYQGAIDVYVSQLGKVELKSHKGSVLVKVASSLQAYLQLSGKEIDVNSEVHVEEMDEAHKDDGIIITGLLNQASKHEKWIKADAPKGTVSFRSQSWFQSLKLQD